MGRVKWGWYSLRWGYWAYQDCSLSNSKCKIWNKKEDTSSDKQHQVIIKCTVCESKHPGFQSWFYCILTGWPWENYLTTLCFNFPICKRILIIVYIVYSCFENYELM